MCQNALVWSGLEMRGREIEPHTSPENPQFLMGMCPALWWAEMET